MTSLVNNSVRNLVNTNPISIANIAKNNLPYNIPEIIKTIQGYINYFKNAFVENMWAAIQDPCSGTCQELVNNWKAETGSINNISSQLDKLIESPGISPKVDKAGWVLHYFMWNLQGKPSSGSSPNSPFNTTNAGNAINALEKALENPNTDFGSIMNTFGQATILPAVFSNTELMESIYTALENLNS